jgi:hypothetical protein
MDISKEDSVEMYGKYKKGDLQFYLQQEPYLEGPCGEDLYYKAWAVDSNGRDCAIRWECLCDEDGQMIDTGDESDACDWTKFKVRY